MKTVIYVRTSTEDQAGEEKASPNAQEQDCRESAKELGLEIVEVIKDTKRYKSKGKMVDPSGTHRDRPGFLRSLQLAREGKIGAILVWDSDRLYRGLPVVDVIETRDTTGLKLFTPQGEFDYSMMMIQAGVAKIELDKRSKRIAMGWKDRLRAGKIAGGSPPYGYVKDETGNGVDIHEDEAEGVLSVVSWYAEGVSYEEIRRRLNRFGIKPRRNPTWSRPSVEGIINKLEEYGTGRRLQTYQGEIFEMQVPVILPRGLYNRAQLKREANRRTKGKTGVPARNVKNRYLLGGLIICPCGWKWGARFDGRYDPKYKSGANYRCTKQHHAPDDVSDDCPKIISLTWLDNHVWNQVENLVFSQERFEELLEEQLEMINNETDELESGLAKVSKRLDEIKEERLSYVRQEAKGLISQDELETLLSETALEQAEYEENKSELEDLLSLSQRDASRTEVSHKVIAELWKDRFLYNVDLSDLAILEDGRLTQIEVKELISPDGNFKLIPSKPKIYINGTGFAEMVGAYKYLDMFEGDLVEATKYGQHANKLEMVQAFVECVRLSGDRDEPKVEVKLRDILRVLNSLAYTRS